MSSRFPLFFFVFFVAFATLGNALRKQSVAVKGVLLCGDNPASNVKVKLWDEDDGPDPDDVLDEGFTDQSGAFELRGTTSEIFDIDPVFKIYTDCLDGLPGQRKWNGEHRNQIQIRRARLLK